MALGTITVTAINAPGNATPIFLDLLSFPGDGAYVADGTPDFEDSYQAAIGSAREVLAVVGQDCGGYIVSYDKANDKLKVWEQTNVATSPLIETVTANLAGTTFNLLVISR
jgi:hypothetical protein